MLKIIQRLTLITFLVIFGGLSTALAYSTPLTTASVSSWPFAEPTTDIPIGRGAEEGSLSLSFLTVIGPSQNTGSGDPFSPINSPWYPGGFYSYQYRIYIPDDYEETAGTSIVRVELFDPDSMNSANNNATIVHTQHYQNITGQPATANRSCGFSTSTSSVRTEPCRIPTCEWNEQTGSPYPHCVGTNNQSSQLGNTDVVNALWYMRVDENRAPFGGITTSYNVAHNTQTRYELYYYQQLASGHVINVPLATYFGLTGDASRDRALNPGPGLSTNTDIQWVSPGAFNQGLYVPAECGSFNGGSDCAGDDEAELPTDFGSGRGFEVDLSQDTPNLAVDPHTGKRYLQLAITAWSGSSENNFSIWAGPPQSSAGLPTDANSRNVWLKNNPAGRPTFGVQVFANTYTVRESIASEIVALPLAEVPANRAGRVIYVSAFDPDTGSKPPLQFYFNTIPTSVFSLTFGAGVDPEGRCFDEGNSYSNECNNRWTGTYAIPVPETFTGGQLWVSYTHGRQDASTWLVRHKYGVSLMPFESELMVEEGHIGGVTATIALEADSSTTYTYYTIDDTATAGIDYIPITGTLAVTSALQTIEIPIVSDTLEEGDETFFVAFVNPNTPDLVEVIAQITILNDDSSPAVVIAPAVQLEGVEGQNTPLLFSVELAAVSGLTLTIPYTTQTYTADGQDFQETAGVLTIPPGVLTTTLPISLVGDNVVEPDEQFGLMYAAGQTTTGTIINDDQLELTNTPVVMAEGDSPLSIPLTLTFNTTADHPITLTYHTLPGTATPLVDYQPISGTVVLPALTLTHTVWLNHVGDEWHESDESYTLVLTYPNGFTNTSTLLPITLLNDDPLPTLAMPEQLTTHENNPTVTLTVTLSQPSFQAVTVGYTTQTGTAVAGQDFVATSGILTFEPGEISQTIAITLVADGVHELAEQFTVQLGNPVNAGVSQATTTITIVDDDPQPTLLVSPVVRHEGQTNSLLWFELTLSAVSSLGTTFEYATQDGTATAGEDYVAMSGQITIPAGVSTAVLPAQILGDVLVEPDEYFELVIGGQVVTATLLNDDSFGVFMADVQILEGDELTQTVAVTVLLTAPSTLPVHLNYQTQEGTAAAGEDYQPLTGTVSFAPGETTQTVELIILGDTQVEADEQFLLVVTQVSNAPLLPNGGMITIVDDDLPQLSIEDKQVAEGDNGTTTITVTVSLSAVFSHTITVNYTTQDGTAVAGTDYQAISGTLTFAPGETSQTITVTVLGDEEVEMDEMFQLLLSNPVNAQIADDTAVITITNDDEPVSPVGYTLFLPVVARP